MLVVHHADVTPKLHTPNPAVFAESAWRHRYPTGAANPGAVNQIARDPPRESRVDHPMFRAFPFVDSHGKIMEDHSEPFHWHVCVFSLTAWHLHKSGTFATPTMQGCGEL